MLQKLLNYLLVPFAMMEHTDLTSKLLGVMSLTLLFAPLAWLSEFLQAHIFTSLQFVCILCVALFVDMVVGIWKHLKLKTFDWKELFTGCMTKVGISFLGLALFSSFTSVEELKQLPTIVGYITLTGKMANLAYVGGSAFNNMFIITGGKFPPISWMTRMKKFQDTLNVKDLMESGKDSVTK